MAVRFDAATDRLSYAASNPPSTTAITVTAWVYNVGALASGTFCRFYNAGTVASFLCSSGGTNGPILGTTGGSVGPYVAGGSGSLPAGVWRRVGFTINAGSCTIFWGDDAFGATATMSGAVATGQPTGVGVAGRGPADASEWFNGRLAHMRIWSAVLSQTQIESEWASVAPLVTSGLWAAWPLSSAADLNDASGNGRHLVAGSTAVTTEDGPPLGPVLTPISAAGATSGAGVLGAAKASALTPTGGSSGVGALSTVKTTLLPPSPSVAGVSPLGTVKASTIATAGSTAGVRALTTAKTGPIVAAGATAGARPLGCVKTTPLSPAAGTSGVRPLQEPTVTSAEASGPVRAPLVNVSPATPAPLVTVTGPIPAPLLRVTR